MKKPDLLVTTRIRRLARGSHFVDGIILIDKEQGCTSFDIVRRVKGLLKLKKVGHAGTLDPFATGLLIILLGQGTKLSSFLMSENKVYLATIRLGIETDTLDSTGKIVRTSPIPPLNRDNIEEGLGYFRGEIVQKPPAYSALKYRGKRAYSLARKGIQFELQERRIKIFQVELLDVALPRVTVRVSCSGGTYIRSLAADIGNYFRTAAHLESLRRTTSGPHKVEAAYRLPGNGEGGRLQLEERIIPVHQSLPGLEKLDIDSRLVHKIRNGYRPALEEVTNRTGIHHAGGPLKLIHGQELIALARIRRFETRGTAKEELQLIRVFPSREGPDG